MIADEPGVRPGMNGSLLRQIPGSVPALELILQGAATGALVASIVLCRARKLGLHIEPWAVTAAWSVLGAAVALSAVVVAILV